MEIVSVNKVMNLTTSQKTAHKFVVMRFHWIHNVTMAIKLMEMVAAQAVKFRAISNVIKILNLLIVFHSYN